MEKFEKYPCYPFISEHHHHQCSWKQLTERDRREWKLSAIDPHDRDTWRSGVRSAMRAASQLPGRGPTVVDMDQ